MERRCAEPALVNLEAWGIADGYQDEAGRWQAAAPPSVAAVASAMGASAGDEAPPAGAALWFLRQGRGRRLAGPAEVALEDGTVLTGVRRLPPDLPLGYHDLHPSDGGPATHLVVSPGRCHLPPELRIWGWAVQLYAARSRQSWGIGDLADLRTLGEWAAASGAGALAVNPLHAVGPASPQQRSPYSPSSRRYRNPTYLRVEDVPGASEVGADVDAAAAAGRALNATREIDRDEVWRLKAMALEACFRRFGGDPDFDAYQAAEGEALRQFATFCALAEHHGNDWRRWPTDLRRPDDPAVRRRVAGDDGQRVRFHTWLQWLLDRQLAQAAVVPLVHDLAVGFDPGGADAWVWQDILALDVSVGAPADRFNPHGQDWGLPPFVPWRLRAARYRPMVETIRGALRHGGGLRIDHVLGLFRLFWIPPGATPGSGVYVHHPASELLDIVALESERAGAFVVGEDLGTVEKGVRAELARRQVLSYRLAWFESRPPERYSVHALAAVTTHDLPTVAGVWTGADLRLQADAGLEPNQAAHARLRRRLRRLTGLTEAASVGQVIEGAYRALARAPCRVLLATLEDALGVEERPNLPGTVDERPNWSLALPVTLEEALADPTARAVGRALASRR